MKIKVLLVEDGADVRESVHKDLDALALTFKDSFSIAEASSALGALRFLKEESYDLLIVDYELGSGLTGVELIKRASPRLKDTLILVTSGRSEAEFQEAIRSLGLTSQLRFRFHAKPISIVGWNALYASMRQELFLSNKSIFFGALLKKYRSARSAHERLRILNTLCERLIRLGCAVAFANEPQQAKDLIVKSKSRSFIPAATFTNALEKWVNANQGDRSRGSLVSTFCTHFITLKSIYAPISGLENSIKHVTPSSENKVRSEMVAWKEDIATLFALCSEFRRTAVACYEEDAFGEICAQVYRDDGASQDSTLITDFAIGVPFCVHDGQNPFLIRPIYDLQYCEKCERKHLYLLKKVGKNMHLYFDALCDEC